MNEQQSVTRSDVSRIMDFAISIGGEVLMRGGELWRVEQAINDIFFTYGLESEGIFMLPHTLIISAAIEGEEPVIRQRYVGDIMVNMDELSRLAALLHKIHSEKPAPDQLMGLLKEATEFHRYKPYMVICGMVVALLSLNYLIGGDIIDALFIGVGIAVVMGVDMYLSEIPGTQKLMVSAVGSFAIGMVDVLGYRFGIVSDPFHIMVVTAIGLVPGIPLINSCREVLCGRVLCGSLLFTQAFLSVLAVVCGFALALSIGY